VEFGDKIQKISVPKNVKVIFDAIEKNDYKGMINAFSNLKQKSEYRTDDTVEFYKKCLISAGFKQVNGTFKKGDKEIYVYDPKEYPKNYKPPKAGK
jgi:hypothetical protein